MSAVTAVLSTPLFTHDTEQSPELGTDEVEMKVSPFLPGHWVAGGAAL